MTVFRCDCSHGYISVEEFDDMVWIGFYARRGAQEGLRKRASDALALLRGRDVLVDDFVLDFETAAKLGKALEPGSPSGEEG